MQLQKSFTCHSLYNGCIFEILLSSSLDTTFDTCPFGNTFTRVLNSSTLIT